MFSPDAKLFFEDPSTVRRPPNDFGILYLLRRDIFQCMGIDPDTKRKNNDGIIWPGAMAILAGIDLLGKFYAGSDQTGKVGARFKKFVDQYFDGILPTDKDVIYQLRNSLLHSFGLYSATSSQVYRFKLVQNFHTFISHTPPDEYLIDVCELHKQFENSVEQYRTAVNHDLNLQDNFKKMFPNYGRTRIG